MWSDYIDKKKHYFTFYFHNAEKLSKNTSIKNLRIRKHIELKQKSHRGVIHFDEVAN